MSEQVGTLLWEWRRAAGWSLSQLAQRAGVSKSALSQWETGLRQPRVPELEATLEALRVSASQRALAFSRIPAPRALRHLRPPATANHLGPRPSAGDLLRAMRLRGGWTQEQIALRVGVRQHTVARWERGERVPSSAEIQALCFALAAHEEELVGLTTGRFSEAPEEMPTEPQAVLEAIHSPLHNSHAGLVDLRYLAMERALWQQAAQEESARPLLAEAYAVHAHYLSLYQRWEEVHKLAERAVALAPPHEPTSTHTLRAVIKLAEATVHGGRRVAPEQGLHLLKAWLPRSSDADYTAWMLSDIGEYLVMSGESERAVEMSEKALGVTNQEQEMRLMDHCRLLAVTGYPGKALDQLPALPERARGMFVYEALIRCEAFLNLGRQVEASAWLERAYAVIEAGGMEYNRSQADALAQRL
jgi:transcriptional regulator with XRE-family HTH domain